MSTDVLQVARTQVLEDGVGLNEAEARQRYGGVIGGMQPMIVGRLLRSRGTRPFYQVRLPAPSRGVAEQLCNRIQQVGGACIALPSA